MNGSSLSALDNAAATITPAEPDIIPQISPITSLQNDDTLSAFFLNLTATSAPFTFLAFIELNGLISALVTAVPIISNKTPNKMNNIRIIAPTYELTWFKTISEPKENTSEMVNDIINICIIHFVFESFFFCLGFFIIFSTPVFLLKKNNLMSFFNIL